MANEGRSGPPDAFAFSSGGGSYRWAYVPVQDKPLITNLQVRTGTKGEQVKVYPSLSLANAQTVKQWDVPAGNVLVEVEVNDGLGAPADEGFVATRMKVLDGSADYAIKVADTIDQLRKRYRAYLDDQQRAVNAAMEKAQKDALGDRKPTGPRETAELMHVSWLPEGQRLRVRFLTRITDGAYAYGGGAAPADPLPLPPPPAKEVPPAGEGALKAPPPPPPPDRGARFGTTFGVELGAEYEVSKSGTLEGRKALPIEAFHKEIPPPPAAPRRPMDPLPPRKGP
jgi:hypothetical protein